MKCGGGRERGVWFSQTAELDDSSDGLQETDCLVMTGVGEGDPVNCRNDVIGFQSTIPELREGKEGRGTLVND